MLPQHIPPIRISLHNFFIPLHDISLTFHTVSPCKSSKSWRWINIHGIVLIFRHIVDPEDHIRQRFNIGPEHGDVGDVLIAAELRFVLREEVACC